MAETLANILQSKVFCNAVGRPFGSWCASRVGDAIATAGDVIDNPAYIIESILRDELGVLTANIDMASFDVVGNPTSGLRKDWKMGRALIAPENAAALLARLCFESHCILTETSAGQYRLTALDKDTSSTFIISQDQMSRAPIVGRTSVKNIRNAFQIGYDFDYSTNNSKASVVVDEIQSGLSSNVFDPSTFTPFEAAGVTTYGAVSTSLCNVSQSRFRVKYPMQEELIWIHEKATADAWTKEIIKWLYSPKITLDIAGWWGDTTSALRRPLLQYEIGDQCRVAHPLLMPDVSSVNFFMVVGKTVNKNQQQVGLRLMEMR